MLPLPLALSRALDLTRSVAGAAASRFLADLGAEVIVLDRPSAGGLREAEPAFFDHLQRNKLACAIDLSRPEGREVVLRLAAASDFIFVDAGDGALADAGLDYAAFRHARPDVIYVCIDAGVDRPGLGIGAAAAALTALFHRRGAGEGQRVDVSFSRLAASLQSAQAVAASGGVAVALPDLPPSGSYRCLVGAVAVVVRSAEQVEALCRAIGRPELASAGESALRQALRDWLASRSAGDAAQALLAAGVAAQPLVELEGLVADPHLRARGLFEPVAQAGKGVGEMAGVPYRFGRTPAHVRLPPPAFGEHTDAVLRDVLGLGAAAIEALRAGGAVS